jgi:hypothetical protein
LTHFYVQNGDAILDRKEYHHIFANFLLCKTKIGSGQYIFGPIADGTSSSNLQALFERK